MCSDSEKRGLFFNFSRRVKERELIAPKRGIMKVVRAVDAYVSSSVEERVEKGEEEEEEGGGGSMWSKGHTSRRNTTREVEPTITGELSLTGREIEK